MNRNEWVRIWVFTAAAPVLWIALLFLVYDWRIEDFGLFEITMAFFSALTGYFFGLLWPVIPWVIATVAGLIIHGLKLVFRNFTATCGGLVLWVLSRVAFGESQTYNIFVFLLLGLIDIPVWLERRRKERLHFPVRTQNLRDIHP